MNEHPTSEPDYGTGKKKFNVYFIGVVLCVVLTLIAFTAVISDKLSKSSIFAIIFSAAVLQFLVQVGCFLRLNAKTKQARVNLMCFLFTILILLVVIIGSLWIMWHLNYNMMH